MGKIRFLLSVIFLLNVACFVFCTYPSLQIQRALFLIVGWILIAVAFYFEKNFITVFMLFMPLLQLLQYKWSGTLPNYSNIIYFIPLFILLIVSLFANSHWFVKLGALSVIFLLIITFALKIITPIFFDIKLYFLYFITFIALLIMNIANYFWLLLQKEIKQSSI